MIKIKSAILVTGVLVTLSSLALDPMPSETGSITKLQIHNSPGNGSERYMVNLDSTITVNEGGELCGMDQWTGYLETKGDQAQFSAILAARLANKRYGFKVHLVTVLVTSKLLETFIFRIKL